MPLTYTQTIIQKLNEYCFRSIWNETSAEYRVNVRLTPITGRYLRGRVSVGDETLALPLSNTQFMVYQAPAEVFYGGLAIPSGVWVSGDTFLTQHKTLLYLYQQAGRLLPRSTVYVYRSPVTNRVLVALLKKSVLKIFGEAQTQSLVYLTVYRDSSQENDITCQSWWVDPADPVTTTAGLAAFLSQAKAINFAGTTVLVNGIEHPQSVTGAFYQPGDYVEILLDRNVIGAYTVNVSNNTTAYYSTKDSKYREILHCPKGINAANQLITHNTCTLSVRTPAGLGRYLHRTDDRAVGQITHNDLSVATDVIDAFRDELGTEDVRVYVRVRVHATDNLLMTGMFYLNMLYVYDDAIILQHLRGELDSSLTFWRANQLENSLYIRLMFDTPNVTDTTLLGEYISGLGYYTVASILSPHVYHTTAGDGVLMVTKPPALLGRKCRPLVYINGRKLKTAQYTYTDPLDGSVRIYLDAGLYYLATDPLSIVLLEDGSPMPYVFRPTAEVTTLTVPFRSVTVYRELPVDPPIVGATLTADTAYEPVAFAPGVLQSTINADGHLVVVAGPSLYGATLILQNSQYVLHDSQILDTTLAEDRGAIVFPLRIACANELDKYVPPLGYKTAEVYVNGYRCIADLDCTIRQASDGAGNRALLEVVISALDYIDTETTGNTLEVVLHTGTTISQETGFAFDDKLSYDRTASLWYDKIGRCYLKGKLLTELTDEGTYLTPATDAKNGDPYYVQIMIPGAIGEILSGYSAATDLVRLNAIFNYYTRTVEIDTSFVIIEQSHRIHSPYLAEIIKDILTGQLAVANDPDPTMFLAQFAAYAYFKARDPAVTDPAQVVNRRFVDVAATYYKDWTVADLTLYSIIHRLVALTLPADPDALGDIANG
jgi:hypothetical protein